MKEERRELEKGSCERMTVVGHLKCARFQKRLHTHHTVVHSSSVLVLVVTGTDP